MIKVKSLLVKPISKRDADRLCKSLHYSGKVAATSQIHLGVFHDSKCYGVMQFGSPIDKKRTMGLVKNTRWNGFLELNRMAFSECLPKNSESRCLSVALRLIKKRYPFVEWILSYSDATQSGDGTIYRATGFNLVGIKKNKAMIRTINGDVICGLILTIHTTSEREKLKHGFIPGKDTLSSWMTRTGAKYLDGFQLKYIYFLNPEAINRLTVPIIPFCEIDIMGAGMYRGQKRAGSKDVVASGSQSEEDGSIPIPALQSNGQHSD